MMPCETNGTDTHLYTVIPMALVGCPEGSTDSPNVLLPQVKVTAYDVVSLGHVGDT